MAGFEYKIVDEIGVISESGSGWKKEVNLISWNGREPKYDIRDWSPEHEKMGKGVTLSKDELEALRELYPFSHRTSYFRVLWLDIKGHRP